MIEHHTFDLDKVLKKIRHYLPEQAPLKDFVHHNTLHAFQDLKFDKAIFNASAIFGYKVTLTLEEYRKLYREYRIREDVLEDRIIRKYGRENADEWIFKLFHKNYDESINPRIGALRSVWKDNYGIDIDAETNTLLFKLLSGYLDQGISLWKFPASEEGFWASVNELESKSVTNFVRTKKGRKLLDTKEITIRELLDMLVGDESLYEQYLFDQQFSHPGWSGLVATIEKKPSTLLDKRAVSLHDLILFELILEIDAMEARYGTKWKPIAQELIDKPKSLFDPVEHTELQEVIMLWQEAFEWSHYDQVLAGISKMRGKSAIKPDKSFQAVFCIDDREGSLRRHIENLDSKCETYGTPGHFGLDFFYQPIEGKFVTKVCPGPVNPGYIIKEEGEKQKIEKDIHFSKLTHHFLYGWFFVLVMGFWSGVRLFFNIFKPRLSAAAVASFSHMGKSSTLSFENKNINDKIDGLQVGYTLDEMTLRVGNVLKSIGLVDDFGKLIYIIGHGASSINNTHYAGYDCGACSGRPGSVNSRVFCLMANHAEVRAKLKNEGIDIPQQTQFLAGLHDTTRDEFEFYDEELLHEANSRFHQHNLSTFDNALALNAKERSRRFVFVNSKQKPKQVHQLVKNRSVSLFEPRPELNHATNSLCIVGRHSLNEGLFLDRRAFSNSYDYRNDPEGVLLGTILNAATPVCGGINLEYYFSRVDNQKLGAGSKLPHNVVGLIGVANGVEGDLRPGLPLQMIEVHDPVRLMMIVEHHPDVVLKTIQQNPSTYNWFINEWVKLAVVCPDTYTMHIFENGSFYEYQTLKRLLDTIYDINKLIENNSGNLPVYLIKK